MLNWQKLLKERSGGDGAQPISFFFSNESNKTWNRSKTKRLPRRARRGAAMLDSLLAMGVFVLALGLSLSYWNMHQFRAGLQKEAVELTQLVRAAQSYVGRDPLTRLSEAAAAPSGVLSISLATLIASGDYPPTSGGYTTRRREMRVHLASLNATSAILVADARFVAGDQGRIGVPRGGEFIGSVGWVAPHRTALIEGPGLRYDITSLQAAGVLSNEGDLGAFEFISVERDVSPYLHRVAIPGRPELNQMATDLDLGGQDILGAGRLEATEARVTNLQGQNITGALTINDTLNIAGTATVTTLDAQGATTVSGPLSANQITVAGPITATDLTTTNITATNVSADEVAARDITATGMVGAQTVVATDLTATDANINRLEGNAVTVSGTLNAASATIRSLFTGGCTGC
jgi:hypothetical protein